MQASLHDRLRSRKFLMSLFTFILSIFYVVTGIEIAVSEVADSIAKTVGFSSLIIWSIVEGSVDKSGAAAGVQAGVANMQVAMYALQTENQALKAAAQPQPVATPGAYS